jgi:hypothetical protein
MRMAVPAPKQGTQQPKLLPHPVAKLGGGFGIFLPGSMLLLTLRSSFPNLVGCRGMIFFVRSFLSRRDMHSVILVERSLTASQLSHSKPQRTLPVQSIYLTTQPAMNIWSNEYNRYPVQVETPIAGLISVPSWSNRGTFRSVHIFPSRHSSTTVVTGSMIMLIGISNIKQPENSNGGMFKDMLFCGVGHILSASFNLCDFQNTGHCSGLSRYELVAIMSTPDLEFGTLQALFTVASHAIYLVCCFGLFRSKGHS